MLPRLLIYFCCLFIFPLSANSELVGIDQCRLFTPEPERQIPTQYSESLLWKIEKAGTKTSYLYGTIHVRDPRVLKLSTSVLKAFNASTTYVMESIPNKEDEIQLSQRMFSAQDKELTKILDDDLFKQTSNILSHHNIPLELASIMQPWAAYLMMNYPPGTGIFLDLKLLNMAADRKMQAVGLETLNEQLSIFIDLKKTDQIQLLLDAVCNYDLVLSGFDTMIELYLQNDLNGITQYSNQLTIEDEKLYEQLFRDLITLRNVRMTDRMTPYLQSGAAFIALGALHLSGEDGVLSLLNHKGYTLTPIH